MTQEGLWGARGSPQGLDSRDKIRPEAKLFVRPTKAGELVRFEFLLLRVWPWVSPLPPPEGVHTHPHLWTGTFPRSAHTSSSRFLRALTASLLFFFLIYCY